MELLRYKYTMGIMCVFSIIFQFFFTYTSYTEDSSFISGVFYSLGMFCYLFFMAIFMYLNVLLFIYDISFFIVQKKISRITILYHIFTFVHLYLFLFIRDLIGLRTRVILLSFSFWNKQCLNKWTKN